MSPKHTHPSSGGELPCLPDQPALRTLRPEAGLSLPSFGVLTIGVSISRAQSSAWQQAVPLKVCYNPIRTYLGKKNIKMYMGRLKSVCAPSANLWPSIQPQYYPSAPFRINKGTGTSVFISNAFSPVSWAHNSFCPFFPSVFLIFRSGITPHENKETVLSKACQRRWVLPCGIQSFNGSVASQLFFSLSCPK